MNPAANDTTTRRPPLKEPRRRGGAPLRDRGRFRSEEVWLALRKAKTQSSAPVADGVSGGSEPVPVPPSSLETTSPELFEAFSGDGLAMYLQPIVSLTTGRIQLVESLARLVLPNREVVAAAQFVPLLDSRELAYLFTFALDSALSNLGDWDAAGLHTDISVNLDPLTLLEPDCALWVKEALDRHAVDPHRLVLELLETRALDTADQRASIDALTAIGVRLAIDDLGSGHSNFARLSHIDFDLIKIDNGILAGFPTHPLQTLSLLFALTQLSQNLGRDAVVEGLETSEMAEVASILGAPLGQGYFFAVPMPADQVLSWNAVDRSSSVDPALASYGAALAFHWRYGRDGRHTGTFDDCPLTPFLDSMPDATVTEPWHSAAHTEPAHTEPENSIALAASAHLLEWLTTRTMSV